MYSWSGLEAANDERNREKEKRIWEVINIIESWGKRTLKLIKEDWDTNFLKSYIYFLKLWYVESRLDYTKKITSIYKLWYSYSEIAEWINRFCNKNRTSDLINLHKQNICRVIQNLLDEKNDFRHTA